MPTVLKQIFASKYASCNIIHDQQDLRTSAPWIIDKKVRNRSCEGSPHSEIRTLSSSLSPLQRLRCEPPLFLTFERPGGQHDARARGVCGEVEPRVGRDLRSLRALPPTLPPALFSVRRFLGNLDGLLFKISRGSHFAVSMPILATEAALSASF